jgi:transposase-like protein
MFGDFSRARSMTFPLVCPRCRQGPDVHRVWIPELSRTLFVCHECDAVYESEGDIAERRFSDLSSYLQPFAHTLMSITMEIHDSSPPPATST